MDVELAVPRAVPPHMAHLQHVRSEVPQAPLGAGTPYASKRALEVPPTPFPDTPFPGTPYAVAGSATAPGKRMEKYAHRQPKDGAETKNSFKKPQQIFASAVAVGEYKASLRADKTFVLAFLAGVFISLGACVALMVGGGVGGIKGTDPGLAKLYFAAMFPMGIIIIVIAGGELVTSNLAIMPSAWLARRISFVAMLRNVIISYLGNLAGSLCVAYFLVYLSGLADDEPWHEFLQSLLHSKLKPHWGQQVLLGIGCNILVCAGVWTAMAAEDIIGKIAALWFPIAGFVAIGFSHCVMSMSLLPAAMMQGSDVSVGSFIWRNLFPVTLGNLIGALLLAVPYWYVYWLPSHPLGLSCAACFKCCKRKSASASPAGAGGAGATAPPPAKQFATESAMAVSV